MRFLPLKGWHFVQDLFFTANIFDRADTCKELYAELRPRTHYPDSTFTDLDPLPLYLYPHCCWRVWKPNPMRMSVHPFLLQYQSPKTKCVASLVTTVPLPRLCTLAVTGGGADHAPPFVFRAQG